MGRVFWRLDKNFEFDSNPLDPMLHQNHNSERELGGLQFRALCNSSIRVPKIHLDFKFLKNFSTSNALSCHK